MYILGLFSWAASEIWGKAREVFFMLDMVPYSLIDNVYNLFYEVSTQNLITETVVNQVLSNVYVLVGIFAFFRIALLLINSIINPDALNKEGVGLSRIFVNTIIMLVLLVFTPTLFSMSRTFAKEVVEGNYIQKLFINVDDSKNIAEPGDEMQRISIAAVLTLDEAVENDKTYQSGKTEKAIQCLNNVNSIGENDTSTEAAKLGEGSKECMDNGKVKWSKVASYNSAKTNTNDGKVYVYSYKPLVLTVTGWVIVYVLLSFTFDVAKRVIELAILEIVSPLFIATIVDPKSMQNGPFKRWLKTLGNSYASLFLRVAAISIMLLCVKLLSYWKPSANVGAFGKLIILIAFLIFIKQLPKWFSNMLGMDGDGTGLGSLGIGKKIGGAALIGGVATKAGHALAGQAAGSAANAHYARKANRFRRKQNGETINSRGHRAGKDAASSVNGMKKIGAYTGGYVKSMLGKQNAKENFGNMIRGKKDNIVGGFGAMVTGGMAGLKAGWNGSDLKDVTGKVKANAKGFFGEIAPDYKSPITRFDEAINKVGQNLINKVNDPFELQGREKEVKGIEKTTDMYDDVLYKEKDGRRMRDKKLVPKDASEIQEMCSELNKPRTITDASGNVIDKTFNFDSTSMASVSGALVQGRIDAGVIDGSSIKVSDDGRKVTYLNSEGKTIEESSTEYCKKNHIYNTYGEQELLAQTKEAGYTKASQYQNNEQAIAEANKTAAIANNQIMQFQANVKTTMGDDALQLIKTLDNSLKEIAFVQKEIGAAQKAGQEETELQLNRLKEAKEKARDKIMTNINAVFPPGTAEGYLSAYNVRQESIVEADARNKENKEIKTIIETSIKLDGNDSVYHVKDKSTNEEFNLLEDTTKTEYGVNLMNQSLTKAQEDAKKTLEKMKPSQNN